MSATAFTYVTAEKAPLYRGIVRGFAEAKTDLVGHLRPEDALDRVGTGAGASSETQAARYRLAGGAHLVPRPDHGRVTTVEGFRRA